MPQLSWDECDFLECLGVEPTEVADDDVRYTFSVERDGMALALEVYPLESVVVVSLRSAHAERSGFTFAVVIRGRAFRQQYRDVQWLEFEDCLLVPNRFSYQQLGNLFDPERHPRSENLRIRVDPHIGIDWLQG